MSRNTDDTWADEGEDAPVAHVPEPTDSRYADPAAVLGQGGLGRVELVRDRDLGRDVARKQMLRDDRGQRERFLREARVTAQLEHPGIVPVYDLGADRDGRPFYTMRRIRGQNLGDALRAAGSLHKRLRLLPSFVDACQAVAFAHARGVLHRDLKPDNVMVGEFGETLVVDWGLARVGDHDEIDVAPSGLYPAAVPKGAQLTRLGATLGTPAYMSPEQARGVNVDARSDVWSLGAILYELLTGEAPFTGVAADVALTRLRENQVDVLYVALSDAPPDLAAIVRKALSADAERRYPNAGALADDVIAWQNGGLLEAYQYSLLENLARIARRHRAAVGVFAIGSAISAAAIATSYRRIVQERDRAQVAEAYAAHQAGVARHRLAASMARAAELSLVQHDLISTQVLALGSLQIAESPRARGLLVAATSEPVPRLAMEARVPGGCALPALGPGGELACFAQGGLRIWEKRLGKSIVAHMPVQEVRDAWALDWSPDGASLVGIHDDGEMWTWRRGDAEALRRPMDSSVSVVFLDDKRVVIGGDYGNIGVFNFDDSSPPRWSSHRATVRYEALVPLRDGRVIAAGVVDPVGVWDPATDVWIDLPGNIVAPMADASDDGQIVLLASGWGGSVAPVHLLTQGGGERRTLGEPRHTVAVGVSADGRRVAVAGENDTTVWDAPDWRVSARIPTDARISAMALADDGKSLVIAETDGDVRVWDLPPPMEYRPRDAGGTLWDVRITEAGRLAVTAGNDGFVRVWDVDRAACLREFLLDPTGGGFLDVDGMRATVSTNARGIVQMDLTDGTERWRVPDLEVVNDLKRLPNGDYAVASDGPLLTRITPDGDIRWQQRVGAWVVSVVPDDRGQLWVGSDANVYVIAGDTGEVLRQYAVPGFTDMAVPLADGGFLAARNGGTRRLGADGATVHDFVGEHDGKVRTIALEGDLWGMGGDDGRITLWAPDGRLRATWPGHAGPVWRMAITPGGGTIVTAGADGDLRRWDLASLAQPVGPMVDAASAHLGLYAADGEVREREAPPP